MYKTFKLFMRPEGDTGGGGSEQVDLPDPTDKEILDGPDEDDVDDKEDKEDKVDDVDDKDDKEVLDLNLDEDEKDEDEDEEDEDDKDKEDKEEEDDDRPAAGLRFKDLKKAYPDVFKKFPVLGTILREHRELSEVFATPDDAKEALQDAEFFRDLERDIMSGDADKLIKSVKTSNPDAFANLALDMVERIQKDDDKLYSRIVTPAIVSMLKAATADAEGAGNQNLKHAALYIAKYLWGKPEIPELKGREKPKEDDKVATAREMFENERAADFRSEVISLSSEGLDSAIKSRLDPKDERLKPYIRRAIIRDVKNEIGDRLGNDVRHTRAMDSLYERSRRAGFNRESKRTFSNAYLQAAKALLPEVMKKVLKEAVGESRQRDRKEEDREPRRDREQRREPTREARNSDRPQRQTRHTPTARDIDWKRTSDKDILNDRYTPLRRR